MARMADERLPRMAWVLISVTLSAVVVLTAFTGVAFAFESESALSADRKTAVAGNLMFATIAGGKLEGGGVNSGIEQRSDSEQAVAPNGASDAASGSANEAETGAFTFPSTGQNGLAIPALITVSVFCAGFGLRRKLV